VCSILRNILFESNDGNVFLLRFFFLFQSFLQDTFFCSVMCYGRSNKRINETKCDKVVYCPAGSHVIRSVLHAGSRWPVVSYDWLSCGM